MLSLESESCYDIIQRRDIVILDPYQNYCVQIYVKIYGYRTHKDARYITSQNISTIYIYYEQRI
jgi:hypothetical protein